MGLYRKESTWKMAQSFEFSFFKFVIKRKVTHNGPHTHIFVCLRPVSLTWLVLRGETLAHEFRDVFETP